MSRDTGCGGWIALGLLGLAIYSCSPDDSDRLAEEYGISTEQAQTYLDEADGDYEQAASLYDDSAYLEEEVEEAEVVEREEFDEDAARDEAESEMSGSIYDRRYGCTEDCSGHEAGWNYRSGTGYETGLGQYGNSQSFDEGARAYEEAVDERVEEMRDEYDSGEEVY